MIAMIVERDIAVTATDATSLLVDHHAPQAGGDQPGAGLLVWIRTPYGRKGIGSIARRFAKAGAHVVVEAVRGTDGSGGEFDPFSVTPADAAAVLAWLRGQAWFPGAIVTWGVSAIGYASWALTEIDVPEWRLAILQDAPSEVRDGLAYPGGIFAGKVLLGFTGGVEWLRAHWQASLARTMLASVRAARRATKVLASGPLGTADERLVGHPVRYFQDWLAHEHDEEYWKPLDTSPARKLATSSNFNLPRKYLLNECCTLVRRYSKPNFTSCLLIFQEKLSSAWLLESNLWRGTLLVEPSWATPLTRTIGMPESEGPPLHRVVVVAAQRPIELGLKF